MLMFMSDVFVPPRLDSHSATWFPASFIRASTSGIRAALSWMMPSMPWNPIGTMTPLRTPLACLIPVCPDGAGKEPVKAMAAAVGRGALLARPESDQTEAENGERDDVDREDAKRGARHRAKRRPPRGRPPRAPGVA